MFLFAAMIPVAEHRLPIDAYADAQPGKAQPGVSLEQLHRVPNMSPQPEPPQECQNNKADDYQYRRSGPACHPGPVGHDRASGDEEGEP